MIELEYPQNRESEDFKPNFSANKEIKPTKRNDDYFNAFFQINPDSYTEPTRKEIERDNQTFQSQELSQYSGNISPSQNNTYSLGLPGKAWAFIYSYLFADENGQPLPFFSTINTQTNAVVASGNKDTLSLSSSNASLTIDGDAGTKNIDLRVNTNSLQKKHISTIGFSTYKDYPCDISNPVQAFQTFLFEVDSPIVPSVLDIEDGIYAFGSPLTIPYDKTLTLQGSKGNCQVDLQFGTSDPIVTTHYQRVIGITCISLSILTTRNVTFDNCIIENLTINGANNISFNNCEIKGTVVISNSFNIAFHGGQIDCNTSSMLDVTTSSNIRLYGVSAHNIGNTEVISLQDSVSVPTSRIMLSDCNLQRSGSSVDLLDDNRTNSNSTQIKMSGMLVNITTTPLLYHNPSTNKIDFTP